MPDADSCESAVSYGAERAQALEPVNGAEENTVNQGGQIAMTCW
jgi:hypothetical protein